MENFLERYRDLLDPARSLTSGLIKTGNEVFVKPLTKSVKNIGTAAVLAPQAISTSALSKKNPQLAAQFASKNFLNTQTYGQKFDTGKSGFDALTSKKGRNLLAEQAGDSLSLGLSAYGMSAGGAAPRLIPGIAKTTLPQISRGALIGTSLLSGGLNAGFDALSGEDPFEGFGRGVAEGPKLAALNALSSKFIADPLINKTGNLTKANKLLTRAPILGGTNILEGILDSTSRGQQYGIDQGLLDFGLGAITAPLAKADNLGGRQGQSPNLNKKFSALFSPITDSIDSLRAKGEEAVERVGKQVEDFKPTGKLTREPDLGNMSSDGRTIKFSNRVRQFETPGEAAGAFAGFEQYQDEEGNTKFRFNPTKAGVGIGLAAGVKNIRSIDRTKLTGKQLDVPNEKLLKNAKKAIQYGVEDKPKSIGQEWDDFYTNWVDRFNPIKKLQERVEKTSNSTLRPEFSPKGKLTELLGAGGRAELRHKQKLDPIIKELGDTPVEEFDLYLKAKRDIELSGRNIKGSSVQDATRVLNALGEKHDLRKFDSVAENLYKYQSENLDKLVRSGFLSDESRKTISEANKKYVPFERIMDDINDFLGLPTNVTQQSTSPIKKIKGSDKGIKSPIESIIANTYKTEAAVAKNNVARSITNLPKIAKEFDTVIRKVPKSGSNTISVWNNGSKEFYSLPDDVARAVKGLNEESVGTVVEVLSAPAKLLRQGATGRNLDFIIPNVFRDQFDAAVNAKYGYKPFLDYFDGLRHLVKFKYGKGDDLVENWINSGGKIYFDSMSGRKDIMKQVGQAQNDKKIYQKVGSWLVSGFDTFGELSESPTRIGVFKRALKNTGNATIAAQESREATLDFARMGAKMKVANQLVPFLNVGVQGFDKMVRSAKGDPKATALKLGFMAATPQLMASLYNNLYHGEEYAEIPDFIKESNFVLLTGNRDKEGNPTYVTIPKGHVVQLATAPVDNFVTWMAGNNPQTFQQTALSMLSGSLPVIGEGNTPREVALRTVSNVTPQAFLPSIESLSNFNFFRDRAIVPTYLQDEKPSDRYFETTPSVYKKLGNVLNMSPLQLQNFSESTFAGFAKQTTNALEVAEGKGSINKIPITRRFVGSYSGFDNERPTQTADAKNDGLLQRFLEPVNEVSAAESLPTRKSDLEVVQKRALKVINGYADKSAEARVDGEPLDELQKELSDAKNILKKIEQERPELYMQIQLDTYGKDGSQKVEDRGEWVVSELKKKKPQELESFINTLWDKGVLTTGSRGVVQYIQDKYGFKLNFYTGKDSSVSKKLSGGSKKVKKIPASLLKPLPTPKVTRVKDRNVNIKAPNLNFNVPAFDSKAIAELGNFNPQIDMAGFSRSRVRT